MYHMESDRKLIAACLARDTAAWKSFVNRFQGLFIHVIQHAAHARSIRLSPVDIDDLTAEIFLGILGNEMAVLKKYRGKAAFSTYLAVIARRIVVHSLVQRKIAAAVGHAVPRQVGNGDQHRVDDREEIQIMLEGLSPADAEIVRRYHIEGRSYREISIGLGIPENSIGPALSRAREKLRQHALK